MDKIMKLEEIIEIKTYDQLKRVSRRTELNYNLLTSMYETLKGVTTKSNYENIATSRKHLAQYIRLFRSKKC